jgi:hypothetical protein
LTTYGTFEKEERHFRFWELENKELDAVGIGGGRWFDESKSWI